jgi:hypothetical protein
MCVGDGVASLERIRALRAGTGQFVVFARKSCDPHTTSSSWGWLLACAPAHPPRPFLCKRVKSVCVRSWCFSTCPGYRVLTSGSTPACSCANEISVTALPRPCCAGWLPAFFRVVSPHDVPTHAFFRIARVCMVSTLRACVLSLRPAGEHGDAVACAMVGKTVSSKTCLAPKACTRPRVTGHSLLSIGHDCC